MKIPTLYRKRIIPEECVLLKNDIVIARNEHHIITKWNTLNPKINMHHGSSCYFLKEGYKVSKFYREDGSLLNWYCDIVDYEYNEESDTYIVTDLLADVVITPDHVVKVLDLDEIPIAMDMGALSQQQVKDCLNRLHSLLTLIYNDKFDVLQSCLDKYDL